MMIGDPPPPEHLALEVFLETQGASAAEAGFPISACPYDPDLPEHAVWVKGWRKAIIRALEPGGSGSSVRSEL